MLDEEDKSLFVPESPEELAEAVKLVTGSSDPDSVRGIPTRGVSDVVREAESRNEKIEWFNANIRPRIEEMFATFLSLPAMVKASRVEIGAMSHEERESTIPGWRKFALTVPFPPCWSDEFIHAANLLLPVSTIITEDCKSNLIEGESIVAVNNFRMQDVMCTNFVDAYVGFSPDVPKEFDDLQKPAFLISFKTSSGRNIFVRGYRATESTGGVDKILLNPIGDIPAKIEKHISVDVCEGNESRVDFRVRKFDKDLTDSVWDEFEKLDWGGVDAYFLMEILTYAIIEANNGEGFMVAGFECDSLPDSDDYLDGGFDGTLSVDRNRCKIGKSGVNIIPVVFEIRCLHSSKVCKGKLTIARKGSYGF